MSSADSSAADCPCVSGQARHFARAGTSIVTHQIEEAGQNEASSTMRYTAGPGVPLNPTPAPGPPATTSGDDRLCPLVAASTTSSSGYDSGLEAPQTPATGPPAFKARAQVGADLVLGYG
jgi:hypothetical protein